MATKPAAKGGRKPAAVKPADASKESRREKFLRLGRPRVSKALKAISLIGNLSSSGYEYTEADVNKINDALADMVEKTIAKFNPEKAKKAAIEFGFDEPAAVAE